MEEKLKKQLIVILGIALFIMVIVSIYNSSLSHTGLAVKDPNKLYGGDPLWFKDDVPPGVLQAHWNSIVDGVEKAKISIKNAKSDISTGKSLKNRAVVMKAINIWLNGNGGAVQNIRRALDDAKKIYISGIPPRIAAARDEIISTWKEACNTVKSICDGLGGGDACKKHHNDCLKSLDNIRASLWLDRIKKGDKRSVPDPDKQDTTGMPAPPPQEEIDEEAEEKIGKEMMENPEIQGPPIFD